MNTLLKFATVSALALMVASPALAQSRIVGTEALNDQIDDITDDVNTDLARGADADRFGPNGVAQGWRGSFALSASGTSGNTDDGEFAGAGRLTYGVGDWNHLFGFAAEYGEANGVKSEEKFFATYEGSRYFTPKFYAFGLARYQYDGYLTNDVTTTVGDVTTTTSEQIDGTETDAFLGFGPGYRVINKADQTWRVQAGPGVRYVKEVTGDSETEFGFIATSRYFYGFNEEISFSMDTDILGSDTNTIVANDAGLNYKLSNNLSTRISYRTEYNTDPAAGLKSTDNTVGISLVLGF
jgi:putative salt-induced outer membrane protein